MAAPASTNLSFLYFLEGDIPNAEKYADLALIADKFEDFFSFIILILFSITDIVLEL